MLTSFSFCFSASACGTYDGVEDQCGIGNGLAVLCAGTDAVASLVDCNQCAVFDWYIMLK